MRIYKFANVLALPFLLILLALGFIVYQGGDSILLAWSIIPLSIVMLIYLFSPNLNYWWISRNPIELEPNIKNMLSKTNPVYPHMGEEAKRDFDNKLTLHVEAREFIGKGMEEDNRDVPIDVRHMIAQVPVSMTLGRKDRPFKNFERVVLYKHPFPSPRFKFLHTAETEVEDGVIILSFEHVERALMNKDAYYNVAWHAYAEAFVKARPKENYPDIPSDIWRQIEQISPLNEKQITATLGYKAIDALPVLINLYFNYPSRFSEVLPEINIALESIFKQAHA